MKKLSKSDIPEGYSYAIINSDTLAWAFKIKPYIDNHFCWIDKVGDDPTYIGSDFDTSDWQNSLI
jgi:hypothetical protein